MSVKERAVSSFPRRRREPSPELVRQAEALAERAKQLEVRADPDNLRTMMKEDEQSRQIIDELVRNRLLSRRFDQRQKQLRVRSRLVPVAILSAAFLLGLLFSLPSLGWGAMVSRLAGGWEKNGVPRQLIGQSLAVFVISAACIVLVIVMLIVMFRTNTDLNPTRSLARKLLNLYQWIFGVIVVGVITSTFVMVLLQQGVTNFWPHLVGQYAALWAWVTRYPLLTTIAAVELISLVASSLIARRLSVAIWLPAGANAFPRAIDTSMAHAGADINYSAADVNSFAVAMLSSANSILTTERAAIAGRRERSEIAPLPNGVVTTSGFPRPFSLFGRAEPLKALLTALSESRPNVAYVVTGLPGAGKTALVAEAVTQAVERGAFHSALWLSCADRTGSAGLASIWTNLATLLGNLQVAQLTTIDQQGAALHALFSAPDRPRLLIALDDIEPGLPADSLVRTLTSLRTALLLTARQALDSSLVHQFLLNPLDDAAAQDLFVARLRSQAPDRPTPEELPALPAIVHELGGLPLAIQLTADYASVQRRSLHLLLAQLNGDGFASIYSEKVTATISRTWRSLSPVQRTLFAGLSMLAASSFPRPAALALATAAQTGAERAARSTARESMSGSERKRRDVQDTPTPSESTEPRYPDDFTAEEERFAEELRTLVTPEQPMEALDALVGLSLVEPLANDRMRLVPLIRDYAADCLREVPLAIQDKLGAAAFAYWLDYAQGHAHNHNIDALETEADGLLLALAWAHDHEKHEAVLAMAHALMIAWDVRGRRREELEIYAWCVQAANALGNIVEQRWATHQLAVTRSKTRDFQGARAEFTRALQLATQLDETWAIHLATHELALLAAQTGDTQHASQGIEQALRLAYELDDQRAIRTHTHELAVLAANTGKLRYAREAYTQALALARHQGDSAAIQRELHELAVLAAQTGDIAGARAGYSDALSLAQELGDKAAILSETHELALLAAQTGDLESARAGLRESLRLAGELGDTRSLCVAIYSLAQLAETTEEQEQGYREALRLATELGDSALEARIQSSLLEALNGASRSTAGDREVQPTIELVRSTSDNSGPEWRRTTQLMTGPAASKLRRRW